jgi:hypothetical protein
MIINQLDVIKKKKVAGVLVKVNDDKAFWLSGTHTGNIKLILFEELHVQLYKKVEH